MDWLGRSFKRKQNTKCSGSTSDGTGCFGFSLGSRSKKDHDSDEEKLITEITNYSPEAFDTNIFLGEEVARNIHKIYLKIDGRNQVVSVKTVHPGDAAEDMVDVLTLSKLRHRNIIRILGYCFHRQQRLLVYEYMAFGSLHQWLHDNKTIDWFTRLKIAAGTIKGLEYLHHQPIIYSALNSTSIMLDQEFRPTLSEFGLAVSGAVRKSNVPVRAIDTYGFWAPEFSTTGQLSLETDIYSFGILLLEIITGRNTFDVPRLIEWAEPLLADSAQYTSMADWLIRTQFMKTHLHQAITIAKTCIRKDPRSRPTATEVSSSLEALVRDVFVKTHVHVQPQLKLLLH